MHKSFAGVSRLSAVYRVVRSTAVAGAFISAAAVIPSAPLLAQQAGLSTATTVTLWPSAAKQRVAELHRAEVRGAVTLATPPALAVSDMSFAAQAAMSARVGAVHTEDAPVPAPRQRNDATLRQNLAMIGVGVTALVLSGVVDDDGVRLPLAIGGAGLTLWGVYRILR